MADANRAPTDALTLLEPFEEDPRSFDFLFAMRLLECANPRQPRLGRALRPVAEPVRLGQEPSLAFPPTLISSAQKEDGRYWVKLLGLGVFGPNGPLPLHMTEFAAQRLRQFKDPTLTAFADLFHHRFMLLLYRAWAQAQPVVQADRPQDDGFANYVRCLAGLGFPTALKRDDVPSNLKLFYGGWYANGTRHAEGLEAMVEDYFGVQAQVEQFVGEWVELPSGEGFVLGRGALGQTTVVGRRIWLSQHKFRLVLGPLSTIDFENFQSAEGLLPMLISMVRGYVGAELSWDVRLTLREEARVPMLLGRRGTLGSTTWVSARELPPRVDDLVFDPEYRMRKASNDSARM